MKKMNVTDLAQKATRAQSACKPNVSLLRRLGIHPTIAGIVVLIDVVLFGGEFLSGMVSLPISIAIGIVMGLFTILMQRISYGDSIPRAILKGIGLGILTAIPTPLASTLTIIGGLLPVFDKMNREEEQSGNTGNAEPKMRNITPSVNKPSHD